MIRGARAHRGESKQERRPSTDNGPYWIDLEQKHAPHTGDCGDSACHYSPSWDGIVRLSPIGVARLKKMLDKATS